MYDGRVDLRLLMSDDNSTSDSYMTLDTYSILLSLCWNYSDQTCPQLRLFVLMDCIVVSCSKAVFRSFESYNRCPLSADQHYKMRVRVWLVYIIESLKFTVRNKPIKRLAITTRIILPDMDIQKYKSITII